MTNEEKEKLREQIKILRRVILEVARAQRVGSAWYTRGSNGLY